MANTIDSGLNGVVVSQRILDAFVGMFAPMKAFSTDFSPAPAERYDYVNVPVFSASTAATTKAIGSAYTIQDQTLTKVQVQLATHAYVSWYVDDVERAKSSALAMSNFYTQKAYALAKYVFQAIAAEITLANFGAASFSGAAANFTSDDVLTIKDACDSANMPGAQRSLVLDSTYFNGLMRDNSIKDASAFGGSEAIRQGRIPSLFGFDVYSSTLIPSNSENLKGFAAYPSALAIAMRYLEPDDQGSVLIEKGPITHAETGITLGYKEWYDAAYAQRRAVLECLYGFETCETNALKRITS